MSNYRLVMMRGLRLEDHYFRTAAEMWAALADYLTKMAREQDFPDTIDLWSLDGPQILLAMNMKYMPENPERARINRRIVALRLPDDPF